MPKQCPPHTTHKRRSTGMVAGVQKHKERERVRPAFFSSVFLDTHKAETDTSCAFSITHICKLAHPGRLVLHPKFHRVGAAHLAFSQPGGWRHLVSPASSARAAGHPYFRFSTQDREARRRCQGDRRRASPYVGQRTEASKVLTGDGSRRVFYAHDPNCPSDGFHDNI